MKPVRKHLLEIHPMKARVLAFNAAAHKLFRFDHRGKKLCDCVRRKIEGLFGRGREIGRFFSLFKCIVHIFLTYTLNSVSGRRAQNSLRNFCKARFTATSALAAVPVISNFFG
jgi:hypothetical protein